MYSRKRRGPVTFPSPGKVLARPTFDVCRYDCQLRRLLFNSYTARKLWHSSARLVRMRSDQSEGAPGHRGCIIRTHTHIRETDKTEPQTLSRLREGICHMRASEADPKLLVARKRRFCFRRWCCCTVKSGELCKAVRHVDDPVSLHTRSSLLPVSFDGVATLPTFAPGFTAQFAVRPYRSETRSVAGALGA